MLGSKQWLHEKRKIIIWERSGLGHLVQQGEEGSAHISCLYSSGNVPTGIGNADLARQVTSSYSWRQLPFVEEFTSCAQISETLPCFWIWGGEEGGLQAI